MKPDHKKEEAHVQTAPHHLSTPSLTPGWPVKVSSPLLVVRHQPHRATPSDYITLYFSISCEILAQAALP
jgi:hypothetical protein